MIEDAPLVDSARHNAKSSLFSGKGKGRQDAESIENRYYEELPSQ